MRLKEDEKDYFDWIESYKRHCESHQCVDNVDFIRNISIVKAGYLRYVEIDNEFDKLSEEDKKSMFQCVKVKIKRE